MKSKRKKWIKDVTPELEAAAKIAHNAFWNVKTDRAWKTLTDPFKQDWYQVARDIGTHMLSCILAETAHLVAANKIDHTIDVNYKVKS